MARTTYKSGSKFIKGWNPQGFIGVVEKRLTENVEKAAQFAVGCVQARAPFRTGVLRGDIDYEIHSGPGFVEAVVGVAYEEPFFAFYGWFFEMGTSKMAARPFLRPAVFNNAAEILRIVRGEG